MRGLKGKRWLLLMKPVWMNTIANEAAKLTELFAMNRKIFKAYLLEESGPVVDVPL